MIIDYKFYTPTYEASADDMKKSGIDRESLILEVFDRDGKKVVEDILARRAKDSSVDPRGLYFHPDLQIIGLVRVPVGGDLSKYKEYIHIFHSTSINDVLKEIEKVVKSSTTSTFKQTLTELITNLIKTISPGSGGSTPVVEKTYTCYGEILESFKNIAFNVTKDNSYYYVIDDEGDVTKILVKLPGETSFEEYDKDSPKYTEVINDSKWDIESTFKFLTKSSKDLTDLTSKVNILEKIYKNRFTYVDVTKEGYIDVADPDTLKKPNADIWLYGGQAIYLDEFTQRRDLNNFLKQDYTCTMVQEIVDPVTKEESSIFYAKLPNLPVTKYTFNVNDVIAVENDSNIFLKKCPKTSGVCFCEDITIDSSNNIIDKNLYLFLDGKFTLVDFSEISKKLVEVETLVKTGNSNVTIPKKIFTFVETERSGKDLTQDYTFTIKKFSGTYGPSQAITQEYQYVVKLPNEAPKKHIFTLDEYMYVEDENREFFNKFVWDYISTCFCLKQINTGNSYAEDFGIDYELYLRIDGEYKPLFNKEVPNKGKNIFINSTKDITIPSNNSILLDNLFKDKAVLPKEITDSPDLLAQKEKIESDILTALTKDYSYVVVGVLASPVFKNIYQSSKVFAKLPDEVVKEYTFTYEDLAVLEVDGSGIASGDIKTQNHCCIVVTSPKLSVQMMGALVANDFFMFKESFSPVPPVPSLTPEDIEDITKNQAKELLKKVYAPYISGIIEITTEVYIQTLPAPATISQNGNYLFSTNDNTFYKWDTDSSSWQAYNNFPPLKVTQDVNSAVTLVQNLSKQLTELFSKTGSIFTFKGTKLTKADIEALIGSNSIGDVWLAEDSTKLYLWSGNKWIELSAVNLTINNGGSNSSTVVGDYVTNTTFDIYTSDNNSNIDWLKAEINRLHTLLNTLPTSSIDLSAYAKKTDIPKIDGMNVISDSNYINVINSEGVLEKARFIYAHVDKANGGDITNTIQKALKDDISKGVGTFIIYDLTTKEFDIVKQADIKFTI